MRGHTAPGHNAFSLVEAVMAIGLFAIGIVSLLGLLGFGLETSRIAEEQSMATLIAEALMEDLRLHNNAAPLSRDSADEAVLQPSRPLNVFLAPPRLPTRRNGISAYNMALAYDRYGNPLPRDLADVDVSQSLIRQDFGPGTEDRTPMFLAMIYLDPHEELMEGTKVEIVVETPAVSPRFDAQSREIRNAYRFASLVSPGAE